MIHLSHTHTHTRAHAHTLSHSTLDIRTFGMDLMSSAHTYEDQAFRTRTSELAIQESWRKKWKKPHMKSGHST